MAQGVRRDEVNLVLTINGSEAGDTIRDLEKQARSLKAQLARLPVGSEDFEKTAKELQAINTQLAEARAKTAPIREGMKSLKEETGLFGKVLQGALGVFGGLGLDNIVGKVLDFGAKIFQMSSNLEGLARKTSTVFGEAESIVRGFAEKNARAIGLARSEYVQLATDIGDLLTPMGFTQEQAAKLSTTLLNQAGVLSEWTKGKVSTQEASEILNKALLGERDALNTLGIDIKDSLIQDELKRKGLDKLTGESLRQAEALITLEQITKQSANANNDFAKASDSATRKKAEFRAKIAEVSQSLAERFVPIMNKAIDIVIPAIEWFAQMSARAYNLYERIGYFKFLNVILQGFGTAISVTLQSLGDLVDGVISIFEGNFQQAWESLKKGAIGMATIGGQTAESMYNAYKGNDPAKKLEGEAANMEKAGGALAGAFNEGFDKEFDALRKNGKRSPAELAKQAKEAMAERIKEIEAAYAKQEALTALALQREQITESEAGKTLLLAKQKMYADQLEAYKRYKQEETKEAYTAQKNLLEVETLLLQKRTQATGALPVRQSGAVQSNNAFGSTQESVAIIQARQEGAQRESIIRDQFSRAVELEQGHQLRMAEIRRNAADINLQRLRDLGLQETDAFKRALDEQLAAQEDFEKKRLDNQQRSIELKRKLEEEAYNATAGFFTLAADLLLEDERNRARNASAIKAFQSASVITSGIAEVAKIWEKAAEFGPLATVVAGIQTGLAVGRTAIAVAKIQKQKFASGGFTGNGWGPADDTGHVPVGIVHANEWVASSWMVRHPVYGAQIAALDGIRRRGFADGGYSTTPAALPSSSPGGSVNVGGLYNELAAKFDNYAAKVDTWARSIYVAYSQISKVGQDLNAVKIDASI